MSTSSKTSTNFPQPLAAAPHISLERKVQALSSPDVYSDTTREVEAVETHFAWVFLTDRFAYKLKKPIRADRLDLTTLELRHQVCREEVRLNLRLAPSVYLGVVPLRCDTAGAIKLNSAGAVIDWLVKMNRLPSEWMLDRAMENGTVTQSSIDSIARLVAEFHARQAPIEFSEQEYRKLIRQHIDDNRAELLAPDLHLQATTIERLHAAQLSALSVVNSELGARAARRLIIEAHGDLRPEHIYLGTPPCVIDALEFSKELRTLDPAEELAFLAVECAHAGHEEIGAAFLQSYRMFSTDTFSTQLFDFYRSHRAATRAKIVAWHLRDLHFQSRQPWTKIAQRYLERALQHAMLCSGFDA